MSALFANRLWSTDYRKRAVVSRHKAVSKSAFTLIELLVVMSLIGVLSAAVLVAINPAKRSQQARDATRKTNLASLYNALIGYYTEKGVYPLNVGADLVANSGEGDIWLSDLAPGYLKQLPKDPKQANISTYLAEVFKNNLANFPDRQRKNNIASSLAYNSGQVLAAVTNPDYDNKSSSSGDGTTVSLTWNHSVGFDPNQNTILIVGVSIRGAGPQTVHDVKAVSASSTKILTPLGGNSISFGPLRTEIWYLVKPDIGSNDITVTLNGVAGNGIVVGASSWRYVNAATPLGSYFSNSGNSTQTSVGVTSTATSDVVVDVVAKPIGNCEDGTATPVGATELWQICPTQLRGMSGWKVGGPGSTTNMRWNIGLEWWNVSAVAIKFGGVPFIFDPPTPADDNASNPTTGCPQTLNVYCYAVSATGQNFTVWGWLENTDDVEIYNKPAARCKKSSPNASYYNYCVSN